MSQELTNADINEAFEDLLFAEENAQKTGYEEGLAAGKTQLIEGYHLGYHRASLLAAQLGYYSGIIECYLHMQKGAPEKIVSLAKRILEDIRAFPMHNDETFDIFKAVEDIKAKYAKFCALAKINPAYPEADKLDF